MNLVNELIGYSFFLIVLSYILYHRLKYVWLQEKLYEYSKRGKFPQSIMYEFNNFYAKASIFMPFPDKKKYLNLYDKEFLDFYKRIRFFEYLLNALVVLLFLVIIVMGIITS